MCFKDCQNCYKNCYKYGIKQVARGPSIEVSSGWVLLNCLYLMHKSCYASKSKIVMKLGGTLLLLSLGTIIKFIVIYTFDFNICC